MLKIAILLCLAGILWDHFYNGGFFASVAGHFLLGSLSWSDMFAGKLMPT